MKAYRLVGSQDPANRIDRVIAEEPSKDHPDGVVLELNGDAVELEDETYARLSGTVKLQPVAKKDMHQVAEFGPDNDPQEAKPSPKSATGSSGTGKE